MEKSEHALSGQKDGRKVENYENMPRHQDSVMSD